MTFDAIETSRRLGVPVTLFLFIYGGEEGDSPPPLAFAYTDAENEIVYDGFTYSPVPIIRSSINASGTLDRTTLTIRMPRDIELAEEFRVWPPTQVMTLIIRQGHLTDMDSPREFLVCWSGRVLSVGREGDECVVAGEPVSSSLRRPGLRRHYQIGCPHVLYSQGVGMCNANKAAATTSGTVAGLTDTTITLNFGWNGVIPAVRYTEGMVEWTNADGQLEVRKILSVNGDTLTLGGLLRDLSISDTVSVILGCNHRKDHTDDGDCFILHNNILNYGGFDWIPIKNPIGFRNQFY